MKLFLRLMVLVGCIFVFSTWAMEEKNATGVGTTESSQEEGEELQGWGHTPINEELEKQIEDIKNKPSVLEVAQEKTAEEIETIIKRLSDDIEVLIKSNPSLEESLRNVAEQLEKVKGAKNPDELKAAAERFLNALPANLKGKKTFLQRLQQLANQLFLYASFIATAKVIHDAATWDARIKIEFLQRVIQRVMMKFVPPQDEELVNLVFARFGPQAGATERFFTGPILQGLNAYRKYIVTPVMRGLKIITSYLPSWSGIGKTTMEKLKNADAKTVLLGTAIVGTLALGGAYTYQRYTQPGQAGAPTTQGTGAQQPTQSRFGQYWQTTKQKAGTLWGQTGGKLWRKGQ